jgi:hypothetical protein
MKSSSIPRPAAAGRGGEFSKYVLAGRGWHYTIADPEQLTEQRWEAAFVCRKAHRNYYAIGTGRLERLGNKPLSFTGLFYPL